MHISTSEKLFQENGNSVRKVGFIYLFVEINITQLRFYEEKKQIQV